MLRGQVMAAVGATFAPTSPMYAQLYQFCTSRTSYTYAVAKIVPGVSITYRVTMTTQSLEEGHTLPALWRTPDVYTVQPFTRLGIRLRPADIIDTFQALREREDYPAELLAMAEHEHVAVVAAVTEFMTSGEEEAYTSSRCAAAFPFATPPVEYVQRALDVQMRMTVTLKPYQTASLAWALWREACGFTDEIMGTSVRGSALTAGFVATPAQTRARACGGLIFEDMGMGKTIEMLGVILADPPTLGDLEEPPRAAEHHTYEPAAKKRRTTWRLRRQEQRMPTDGMNAGRTCAVAYAEPPPALDTGGTLVVVPVTLCNQWMEEVRDKVAAATVCEPFLYHGPKRSAHVNRLRRHASEVVITTYETVTADTRAAEAARTVARETLTWTCSENQYIQPTKVFTGQTLQEGAVLRDPARGLFMQIISFCSTRWEPLTRAHMVGDSMRVVFMPSPQPLELQDGVVTVHNERLQVNADAKVYTISIRGNEHVYGYARKCSESHPGSVSTCAVCGFNAEEDLRRAAVRLMPDPLNCLRWRRVVLDESHKIQDDATKLYAQLMTLRSEKRWCMTGTPMATDVCNLWGQLRFLGVTLPRNPRDNLVYNQWLLKDAMVRHTKANTAESLALPPLRRRQLIVNLTPEERERYNTFYVRTLTRSRQVTDMVAHTNELLQLLYNEREACAVTLPATARATAVVDFVEAGEAAAAATECPVCMELAAGVNAFGCAHTTCYECLGTMLEGGQSACPMCRSPMPVGKMAVTIQLCKKQAHNRQLARAAAAASATPVVDAAAAAAPAAAMYCASKLEALLTCLEKHPLPSIVFTQFGDTVEALFGPLVAAGFTVLKITGDMTAPARAAAVATFRATPARVVFLLTLRTASCGLNLTHGKQMFFMDAPLSERLQLQGESRVHRYGQDASVEVIYLFYANTVEERIWKFRAVADSELVSQTRTADGTVVLLTDKSRRLQRQAQLLGLLMAA